MSDYNDKDPFAEYDKYWDELDKIEEPKKEKREPLFTSDNKEDQKKIEKNILSLFISFGFAMIVMMIIFTGNEFMMTMPMIIMILFVIIIAKMIVKQRNK